jgi:hypothetical protein
MVAANAVAPCTWLHHHSVEATAPGSPQSGVSEALEIVVSALAAEQIRAAAEW